MRKSSFEDLECWKASRDLRLYVTKEIVPTFPKEEKFRLADQMIRASRSVTANIAEGYGRYHYLDEAKFLSNSRGSLHEVLDHGITGLDEGLLTPAQLGILREKAELALKLLNGYRAYLLRKAKEK